MAREVIVRTDKHRLEQLLDPAKDLDELKLDVISPGVSPIKLANVEYGMDCDIAGIVRSIDSKNTFTRDDGDEGQVRGIRIQDSTADIRCALWGDHADVQISQGDPILIRNAEIQDGWQDDIEASVGWSSEIEVLEELEIDFVTIRLRGSDTDGSEGAESDSESEEDSGSDGSRSEEDDEEAAEEVPDDAS
jgi:replication factor A1